MDTEVEELPVKTRQPRSVGRPGTNLPNPTVGVKSDFEKLLTKFTETKSVRYEEFSAIWKEMKMSLLFAGRQSDMEVREFVEDCMNIALTFLMPPYNFQVRVCALYIVYGLFWKQPCRPMAKIRITQEQWKELDQLMEEVKEQQHLDVEYVYTMLEYNRAFTFVATSRPMYPYMRDIVDDDKKILKLDAMAMLAEQKSILSEILEPDNIDQLSAIHEQYHRLKCLLNQTDKTKPKASMDVVKPSLVQYITKSVAAYEEKRKVITGKKPRKRHDSKDSAQTTTSESEPESDVDHAETSSKRPKRSSLTTGTRRAEIKARAFAGMEQTSKSRRHRQVLKETLSDEAMSSFSSPSPIKRPKKGKSPNPAPSTSAVLPDAVDITDISPWGDELRSSLLSMPLLMAAEESPVSVKKKNKKSSKTGKASKAMASKNTAVVGDSISPKTKKGKRKKSSTTEIDTTLESNTTPKIKVKGKGKGKKTKSNSSELGSLGNMSTGTGDLDQSSFLSDKDLTGTPLPGTPSGDGKQQEGSTPVGSKKGKGKKSTKVKEDRTKGGKKKEFTEEKVTKKQGSLTLELSPNVAPSPESTKTNKKGKKKKL